MTLSSPARSEPSGVMDLECDDASEIGVARLADGATFSRAEGRQENELADALCRRCSSRWCLIVAATRGLIRLTRQQCLL